MWCECDELVSVHVSGCVLEVCQHTYTYMNIASVWVCVCCVHIPARVGDGGERQAFVV